MRAPHSRLYADAGVDLTAAASLKSAIHELAAVSRDERVLSRAGAYCGVYDADPGSDYLYVSSTDSVGTKVRIAQAVGRHDTIGYDLVNHCVNDILPSGAEPLFFLDYIGSGGFDETVIPQVVAGLSGACLANGCVLIGGETASLPGMYQPGDYDLVGFIVGRVRRTELKDVDSVGGGDVLIGLPSSGVHTNGYSLIRKVFGIDSDPSVLSTREPVHDVTLGEMLLTPHRSYRAELAPVMDRVKSLAHITGGSFGKNVPRALPGGLHGVIDRGSWQVPALFQLIQRHGEVDDDEMFSVFNMGVGMIAVVDPADVEVMLASCEGAFVVGSVERDAGDTVHGVEYV